jgi:hypothetical protein
MFLDTVSLEGIKVATVKRDMSNWMKLANAVYTDLTEENLLVMMKLEYESKNREYILTRLHARYNALRMLRERKELLNASLKQSQEAE